MQCLFQHTLGVYIRSHSDGLTFPYCDLLDHQEKISDMLQEKTIKQLKMWLLSRPVTQFPRLLGTPSKLSFLKVEIGPNTSVSCALVFSQPPHKILILPIPPSLNLLLPSLLESPNSSLIIQSFRCVQLCVLQGSYHFQK